MFIEMNKSIAILLAACLAVAAPFTATLTASGQKHPTAPKSLRLYVFDCGVLKPADAKSFGFDKVSELKMSVPDRKSVV